MKRLLAGDTKYSRWRPYYCSAVAFPAMPVRLSLSMATLRWVQLHTQQGAGVQLGLLYQVTSIPWNH